MRTCATIGQAVGTAAALAVSKNIFPRDVYASHIGTLQQMLLRDDCYLPGIQRKIPSLTSKAQLSASDGDPEPLRNGIDRQVDDTFNGWKGAKNGWVEYRFGEPTKITETYMVFDSDLARHRNAQRQLCCYPLDQQPVTPAETLIKSYRLELQDEKGQWSIIYTNENNYLRFVTTQIDKAASAIRFIPVETWGSEQAHLFAWDVV